ncbi:MAG: anti-sigma factor [Gammaproteobacteria bacterium]|nr:anti-sigma factor [Gammaproteobacteria bacterium]
MSDIDDITEPDDSMVALEYVLGLLDRNEFAAADARRRADLAFDREISAWETRLVRFYAAEPAVTVPAGVRDRLLARLFPPAPEEIAAWRRGLALWRGFALAASVGVIALGVALLARIEPASAPSTPIAQVPATLPPIAAVPAEPAFKATYCALFKTDERMEWIVWADPRSGKMRAIVPGSQVAYAPDQHAMELWMLPADGSAPRSLGILPASGKAELAMPTGLIEEAKGLAVSQEPPGGSPTGLPTGPVLYQSPWWSLG